jgi:hypothetical protein
MKMKHVFSKTVVEEYEDSKSAWNGDKKFHKRYPDRELYVFVNSSHQQKEIDPNNVLLDSGCSITIFDPDILERIGIELDLVKGKTRVMYGVGGIGELCYEQNVGNLEVDFSFVG